MGVEVHNQVSPVRLALCRPMTLLGYFPVYKDSWHTKQLTSRTFRREQLGSSRETVSNYLYPLDDWPDDSNHPSTSPSVGRKPDRPNLTEYHAVVRTVRIPLNTQPGSNNTTLPASWNHKDNPFEPSVHAGLSAT